jgi:hypothetical protein
MGGNDGAQGELEVGVEQGKDGEFGRYWTRRGTSPVWDPSG